MPNISLWALLPPIYSALTATGLWVVYFVAVGDETVAPLGSKYRRRNGSFYPPYISMAGNFPPASCIFGEVMNLAAFGGLFIAVLRCLQLKHITANAWLNVGSMAAFSVACFGMTLVGNFQLFSDEDIHNVGTFLTFWTGNAVLLGAVLHHPESQHEERGEDGRGRSLPVVWIYHSQHGLLLLPDGHGSPPSGRSVSVGAGHVLPHLHQHFCR